ncbi:hypothetical protein ACFUCV_07895 [Specibacter sp. NPDC057265]|uniref:hypothetical protein n=1 Tax=Specibacter sp. NPDC057265 TaxID=3346075 RepID=UPI00362C5019
MQTSSSRARRLVGWLGVLVVSAGLLIGGGIWLTSGIRDALAPGLSFGCTAVVNGTEFKLALDQSENAALIASLSARRGMPARAASIALATALQESKLRNIDYGDLDSVGLFQQRPSQGWGTVEQIMDPAYSANAFYDALAEVPDYVNLPINDAAQIVQRSGYPEAYAQHEPLSRAFASALTGQSPQALSCTLPAAGAGSSSPEAVMAAAQAALGPVPVRTGDSDTTAGTGAVLTFDVTEATGWATAHWAVAHAQSLGIETVSHAGLLWDRNANAETHNLGWQQGSKVPAAEVSVTLAQTAAG